MNDETATEERNDYVPATETAVVVRKDMPDNKDLGEFRKKAMPKGKKTMAEKSTKNSFLMPDGAMIDLDSYDWGKEKLTEKQKLFVVWFSLPGTEYYHCAMKAARKAGYTPKSANVAACKMRRDPRLDKLIRQFEETIGKKNLLDAAERFLQDKIVRADFNVRDFYELKEEENPVTGKIRRVLKLKDMNDMTREQLLCIDGIDIKGQQGIPVFILADRQKERDSIIAFAKKEGMDKGEDEYDIETVAEIIKGNLQVKTKVITRNKEIMTNAEGFVDAPKTVVEEE